MPTEDNMPEQSRIPATSPDIRQEILNKIREMYPALFGEGGSLNVKELESLVDDYSKPEAERYSFPWAGKTASKRLAFTPSKARLVPDQERSVDFDTTQNLIIEGENLEVLKLLQASYFKKVKMIYIDPPYNTGHDFVYPDDYSESKQAYWEKNGVYRDGVRMDTNTESSGRYHSNWLSMMQSRMLLARNLLRDDGVVFVSIDDNEVHNLRRLMDEIFGEENFLQNFLWLHGKGKKDSWSRTTEQYIIAYAKYKDCLKPWSILASKNYFYSNPDNDPRGEWFSGSVSFSEDRSNKNHSNYYTIKSPSNIKWTRQWQIDEEEMKEKIEQNKIYWGPAPQFDNVPRLKIFPGEIEEQIPSNLLDGFGTTKSAEKDLTSMLEVKVFDYPKSVQLIQHLASFSTEKNDLIFDFFAGSGTTAQAVMELNKEDGGNRKFILVQLPEATDEKSEAFKAGYKTISQITIERVKRAGAKITAEKPEIDAGFKVFRLSKSLFPRNLFEIDPDMTEEQKVKAWVDYLENYKQMELIGTDRTELLFEIALKDGFDFNFKAEPMQEFKQNKVLGLSDGEKTALVCLDDNIHEETVKALVPYVEQRFICLERSLDSTRKWNLRRMFGERLWVA